MNKQLKEEFNHFEEALLKSNKYGRHDNYVVLALEGDITKWYTNERWWGGKSEPLGDKVSDRKKESQRHLAANVLVYTKDSMSLDWNTLYKNTKGVYFKKQGKNIYLDV